MKDNIDKFNKILVGVLGIYLIAEIILSLQWRIQLDLPIMLYLSFLKDKFGYVPYRDFFDMNMPGAYEAYSLIGRISGYHDLGVRLVDIILIIIIILVTYFWMKKFGRVVALSGGILFGLTYLRLGPNMSLEREYISLVAIVVAVWVASLSRLNFVIRNGIVGILFGIAATIKPQAAIGFAPILIVETIDSWRNTKNEPRKFLRLLASRIAPIVIGFLIPLAVMFVYLWSTNALNGFINMATNYWPLYAGLNGVAQPTAGVARLKYDVENLLKLGGNQLWLVPCLVGILFLFLGKKLLESQDRQLVLLILLAIAYSLYPIVSGQFWFYHWIIFVYFIIQLSSLCFIKQDISVSLIRKIVPIVAILSCVIVSLYPSRLFTDQLRGRPLKAPEDGRADEIARYLKANLKSDDLVQPLDWTGGAVQAMLISNARLATPYVYDFYFYHNVSSPYIQTQRERFIESMEQSHPRFIVQVDFDVRPMVSGNDTTYEFKELNKLLDRDYSVADQGKGFKIYELNQKTQLHDNHIKPPGKMKSNQNYPIPSI
jgi:hypothetical protein